MLSMTSEVSGLEELSLIDICGKDTDLGAPLQVGSHSWSYLHDGTFANP